MPIIDFSDPNVSKLVGLACETWGSFLLKNHSVPLNLKKSAESKARNLFSEKHYVHQVTGYGLARMSQFFSHDVMVNFQEKLKGLSEQLMLIILDYLGIPKGEMKRVGSNLANEFIPFLSRSDPNNRASHHTDTDTDADFLTILRQTSNPSRRLQIHRDGFGLHFPWYIDSYS
ncbi:Non-hem dioxygenase N-terminal domain [Dillenia turbinata]|uniref:Non-hem dioxygenase N-terminal domain n=1 Tax=Dillenia turbinata TaxID=194707 RepID=A0AAN8ZBE1_9MAGN